MYNDHNSLSTRYKITLHGLKHAVKINLASKIDIFRYLQIDGVDGFQYAKQ